MNTEGESHAEPGSAPPRPAGGQQEPGRRQPFLLKFSDALRPLGDPQSIRAEAARQLGLELAVDRAFYAEVDEQGRAFFAFDYCSEGMKAVAGRYRLDDFGVAAADALRAGRTVVVPDIEGWTRLSRAEKQRCRRFALRACLKVPLVKDSQLVAFFALHQSGPREWTDAEVALTTEVAERTWAMVERAKAETALRISDEKYRSLFEAIDEGVCLSEVIYADDGNVSGLRYLEVNPAFERHTGLHGVIGKTTGEVLPNLESHWLDAIARVIQTGQPVRMENYLSDLGRWYDLQHSRVGGPGSTLLATVFADITERKRVESTTSRLAAIVESSDDAIIRKDLDGIIQTWNAGAERMFGYAASEVIGKPVTILMPPDRVNEEPGILARIRSGQRVDHYETIRQRKDGSLLDVSLTVSPIVGGDGTVVAASKIARDITQRKRVEALLRERDEGQTFLLRLTDALRGESDPDALARIAINCVARQLHLDRAYVARVYSGEDMAVIGPEYRRKGLKSIAGSVHISDFPESYRQVREGTLMVSDVASDPLLSERDRQSLAAIDLAGFVCVGVCKGELDLVWALVAGSAKPRVWTLGEIALVQEVAERAWAAIERARADAALVASEQRYRTLFNSIDEGFCTVEVLFDENGKPFDYRFLSTNTAFEQQTGLHDAVGRRMRAMVPQHESHWFEVYGRIARTGKPERFEQRADALGRWYEVFAFPLGPPNQLGILFRDVLERKRAESNAALLDGISREVAIRSTPDDIMWVVGSRANTWLDVSACIFADVDDTRGEVTIRHGWNARDVPSLKQTFRLDDYLSSEFARASRAGEMVIVRDTTADDRTDAAACAELQIGAFVTVPFHRDGHWIAYLAMADSKPRDWREDEIAVFRQITDRVVPRIERARAEERLRESEEKYRSLFQTMGQAYVEAEVVRDSDGEAIDWRFVEVNPAFERVVDLPAERVRGGLAHEVSPDLENWWVEAADRVVRGRRPERVEHEIAKLGRWLECYFYPAEGERFIALCEDITERKQAEAALRGREERQKFLLEFSDALRAAPDEDAVASAAARLLAEEMKLDRSFVTTLDEARECQEVIHEFHHPDLVPIPVTLRTSDVPAVLGDALQHTLVFDDAARDDRLTDPDRRSLAEMNCGALIASPLRRESGPIGCFVGMTAQPRRWLPSDIALIEAVSERTWTAIERGRAETALREREVELQRVSQAKDEFIAMLSHELRNPLAPIANTLQLMKLRAPDVLVRERAVIEGQVRHLTGLVNDLLDVARITSGKVELESESMDIREVVAAAVEIVQAVMEAHQQSLHVQVEDGLMVSGDRRRLVQVLVNLLANAAKYSPPDRNVWLSAAAENGEVVVHVRDEGQGIPADLLSRIFESFTQGKQSLDRSRGGLGLGLAIVRNLVMLHGGSVSAASEGHYKGSEFTVRLPLLEGSQPTEAPAMQAEPANGEPATADSERIKVLIVDDYAPAADSLAMLLQEMGYRTHVVNDGAAALQAVKIFKPQVALVDIGLPVIDGYEVAQTVRRMPDWKRLPLIAVTGYGQPGDHARVMEAGFDEHVVKPLDASRISEMIEQMLAAS